MAFRMLNIGDGKRILPASSTTVFDGYTYSRTGKAFTGAVGTSGNYTYYLFTLPDYIGADLWIAVDLYLDSTNTSAGYFRFGYWNSKSAFDSKNVNWLEGLYLSNGNLGITMESGNGNATVRLERQAINKIVGHIHNEVGGNASYSVLNVNGVTASRTVTRNSSAYTIGSQVTGLKTMAVFFPRVYPCYLSNLIISDEEISPNELVIELPISSTSTNMTAGLSGSYTADATGQTLLQTPDVSALTAAYGANSQITGIEVVGNPAYTTGTGLASATGISKSGASIIEHNTRTVPFNDETGHVSDGWKVSNTSIADLQNMQFGWKVGA